MHFNRQAMAMRVPQGPDVAQEASLLFDGQALPDVLHRGTQAVDDRLPRRAMRLGRGTADGDRGGQSGYALGAGQSDLLRHEAAAAARAVR